MIPEIYNVAVFVIPKVFPEGSQLIMTVEILFSEAGVK
jgi:hypothetical protein